MITKRQALTGESFNAVTGGRCILWRRNGCHRTWQTQPERFKIPVRRGLHDKDHPPRRRMPGPEHAMTSARRRWGRGREHVAGGAAYRMVQDGTRRAVIATWPGTDPAGAGVVAGWVAFDLRGHCRGRRARVRPLPGRSLPRPRVNPPRGGSPDRRRPPGNQPRALRRRSLTMPSRTAPATRQQHILGVLQQLQPARIRRYVTGLLTYRLLPGSGSLPGSAEPQDRIWQVTVNATHGEMATAGWVTYDWRGRRGGRRCRYACYIDRTLARGGDLAYLDHARTPAAAMKLIADTHAGWLHQMPLSSASLKETNH